MMMNLCTKNQFYLERHFDSQSSVVQIQFNNTNFYSYLLLSNIPFDDVANGLKTRQLFISWAFSSTAIKIFTRNTQL